MRSAGIIVGLIIWGIFGIASISHDDDRFHGEYAMGYAANATTQLDHQITRLNGLILGSVVAILMSLPRRPKTEEEKAREAEKKKAEAERIRIREQEFYDRDPLIFKVARWIGKTISAWRKPKNVSRSASSPPPRTPSPLAAAPQRAVRTNSAGQPRARAQPPGTPPPQK